MARPDHRQPAAAAPPLPLPARFNARYRRFDSWLRGRPAILGATCIVLIIATTLVRTFPLTALLPLGGMAMLAAAALALGFAALGPLGALATALWAVWSPLGDLTLGWLLGVAPSAPVAATIAAPAALFVALAGANWWFARRHGWDLRGSFAVALSLALSLAPLR